MDVNEKLDEILRRIEGIEEHLNIKPPKSKYKLKPLVRLKMLLNSLVVLNPKSESIYSLGCLKNSE